MGSLTNGIPPIQHNESVVNTGHSIDVKNYKSDALVVERAADSNSDLLAELEATIRANNPILWLDMSDQSTMTLDGDNKITEWRHKLDSSVKAEATGILSGKGPTLTSSMVDFGIACGLSLGEQLDGYMTGSNSWTVCASVYMGEKFSNWDWFTILSKDGTTGNNGSFLLILEDPSNTPGTFSPMLFINSNGVGGNNIRLYSDEKVSVNSKAVITSSYDHTLVNSARIDMRTNTDNSRGYEATFGGTFASIKDTTWPLTIGKGIYSIAQGYRVVNGIHELIIFSSVLSDEMKLKVETYLAMKRGFTRYLESHRPHD